MEEMTYAFRGMDHVQLAAPKGCEAEARAFYGGVLDLPEIPKPINLQARGGVWFECGGSGQQIHIGVEEPFAPAKKAHPAFLIDNLAALQERLQTNGVPFKNDDLVEGVLRFHAEDPFGNRLEFMERV